MWWMWMDNGGKRAFRTVAARSALMITAACCAAGAVRAGADDVAVYDDSLAAGWANWSWDAQLDFAAASPIHGGTAAISVTYTSAWAGVYLHVAPTLSSADLSGIRFWLHGGDTGGQRLNLALYDASGNASENLSVTAPAGEWLQVEAGLGELGSPAAVSGIVLQDATGSAQQTFFLDDMTLLGATGTPTPTPVPGVGPELTVNAGGVSWPIDERIYGMNFADEALATELRLPVNRWGGNATTRYNYLLDTANHASDWFFENIPKDNANPGQLPDGSQVDELIAANRRSGTASVITLPLIGWVPRERAYACGFSVAKYGAQQQTDPWRPDCGDGVDLAGQRITGNDPADTSQPADPAFVAGWIAHLVSVFGAAAAGGVTLYNLDNEPMLWNDTHRDVHPTATSYDEMRDRTIPFATAVKDADPGALTLGPVLWGWTAYFYSALDWEAGGSWWQNPPDRLAHGDVPFVAWYLEQMRAAAESSGRRLLDFLDLHYYPQAAGVSLSPAGSAATQALRLRSTRALWDSSYVDESWIAEPVRLLPRMREWVDTYYPGTKLAITEYNWGALDHINGAVAQADVLGLFGREGLHVACLWDPPASTEPGAFAFRMYRNFDGQGGRFGDTGIPATSADADAVSVFAARRTVDAAITVIIVNKSATSLTSTLTMEGLAPPAPTGWRYSAADLGAIVPLGTLTVTGNRITVSLPAASITALAFAPDAVGVAAMGWVGGAVAMLLTAALAPRRLRRLDPRVHSTSGRIALRRGG